MNDSPLTGAAERRVVRRVHQLAEIVALIEHGEVAKAADLTRLHLADFPSDTSIVEPLTRRASTARSSRPYRK